VFVVGGVNLLLTRSFNNLRKRLLAGLFRYPYIDTIDRPSPLAGQILLQLTLSNQNLLLNKVLCQGGKDGEDQPVQWKKETGAI
jgi:hypothetical protein